MNIQDLSRVVDDYLEGDLDESVTRNRFKNCSTDESLVQLSRPTCCNAFDCLVWWCGFPPQQDAFSRDLARLPQAEDAFRDPGDSLSPRFGTAGKMTVVANPKMFRNPTLRKSCDFRYE